MNITKKQLKSIIKEEIESFLGEELDEMELDENDLYEYLDEEDLDENDLLEFEGLSGRIMQALEPRRKELPQQSIGTGQKWAGTEKAKRHPDAGGQEYRDRMWKRNQQRGAEMERYAAQQKAKKSQAARKRLGVPPGEALGNKAFYLRDDEPGNAFSTDENDLYEYLDETDLLHEEDPALDGSAYRDPDEAEAERQRAMNPPPVRDDTGGMAAAHRPSDMPYGSSRASTIADYKSGAVAKAKKRRLAPGREQTRLDQLRYAHRWPSTLTSKDENKI